jgi:hypothetical protein
MMISPDLGKQGETNMKYDCRTALVNLGISQDDADALRRISMTLHRWHELECGDSNDCASRSLVRGRKNGKEFEYADNGSPFMETHSHQGSPKAQYFPVPDRERGALKRLAKILERYPNLGSYIQGDPRGASLYIIPRDKIRDGMTVDSCYSSIGIAVYK